MTERLARMRKELERAYFFLDKAVNALKIYRWLVSFLLLLNFILLYLVLAR